MTKEALASLGSAEAEILKIVWELKSATVQEVWENLPADRNIQPSTVQTVLRRLREKGYVGSKASGKAHVFHPTIQKEKVISKTIGDLVKNFFGGKATPLLMHLVDKEDITHSELKKLKQIIEEKSSGK